jgi:uncharacterized metal-binding protein YceD (DUF177 family)
MVKIFIQGIEDGTHEIVLAVDVNSIPSLSSEFIGDVTLKGSFKKNGQYYVFDCKVECPVRLICDMSLEEYEDTVGFDFRLSFVRNTGLFFEQKERELGNNEKIAFHEEEKTIDITEIIREELSLHLPMRRIAPEYRDKSFEELFPEYSNKKKKIKSQKEIDDRWSQLKKLKLN